MRYFAGSVQLQQAVPGDQLHISLCLCDICLERWSEPCARYRALNCYFYSLKNRTLNC
jgi:hypothetical protein